MGVRTVVSKDSVARRLQNCDSTRREIVNGISRLHLRCFLYGLGLVGHSVDTLMYHRTGCCEFSAYERVTAPQTLS